jgi:predicted DNA-binding transcriptional regulator YafY
MTPSKDFIRQSELLSMCLIGLLLSKTDYAEMFNVDEITINRDIQKLKQNGIDIFSRKKILQIGAMPSNDILTKFASDYLPLKLNSDLFFTKIKSYQKVDKEFFKKFILISKACKENYYIKVKYRKANEEIKNYSLKPIQLVNNELNWILHAYKENSDILQTFYLTRILSFDLLNKRFKLPVQTTNNDEKFDITLKFDPEVKNEIFSKIFFDEFEVEIEKDGFIILTTYQPITNHLASWCISWYDTIEIISPVELKIHINKMIESYKSVNK